MKNKIIIIGIILIIFLGLNFNNFSNFYYNVSGNYEKTNNLEGQYNIGTNYYIEKNYEKAIKSFSGILDEKNKDLYFRLSHNLANSYYKYGVNKNLDEKIGFYTQSVEKYREALSIKIDEETQKNLEFVEENLRLAKLEKKKTSSQPSPSQDKEQEQNENQNKEDGSEKSNEKEENGTSDKNEGEKSGEEEGEESGKEQGGGDGENNNGKLSEETKKILEKKAEELEDLQEQIGKFYNKTYKDKLEPFNNFNDFFDNSLLDDNEEKDW